MRIELDALSLWYSLLGNTMDKQDGFMEYLTLPDMLDSLVSSTDGTVDICKGWLNGRAAYGGLVTSLAVTEMLKVADTSKPIRSLMTNFVAPLPPGPARVEGKILRSGRSVTQAVADVMAGDQVAAHVSAAFGTARPAIAVDAKAPFKPFSRDSVPSLDSVDRQLLGFLEHFDIHWGASGIPMSGNKDHSLAMWVRHKVDMAKHPVASIVAATDIPPPIMLSHYDRMIPASSLSWSIEFLQPAETIEPGWFYLEFSLEAASGGYTQQSGRIFTEDGTLCALSRQCMVYFE